MGFIPSSRIYELPLTLLQSYFKVILTNNERRIIIIHKRYILWFRYVTFPLIMLTKVNRRSYST